MGAADPLGAGALLTDGDAVGAGAELMVGAPAGDTDADADGDVAADGAAAGVTLAGAAGADVDGAEAGTVLEALGADVAGVEVTGEVADPDTACPACAPDVWCVEATRAMPPAADAASSPTTIEATVRGLPNRRR